MAIAVASVVAACGTQESGKPASQQDVPAIIQNWGFNFADYSEATGKAGDMLIKGVTPPTFTGSTAAKEVYPNGNVYCASKFAVDAISIFSDPTVPSTLINTVDAAVSLILLLVNAAHAPYAVVGE